MGHKKAHTLGYFEVTNSNGEYEFSSGTIKTVKTE